jgi:hypothetical protein
LQRVPVADERGYKATTDTAATVEYRMARSALVTAIASTCPAWPVASRPAAGAGGHVPDTRTVEVV